MLDENNIESKPLERVSCQECKIKFFAGAFNRMVCPKCKTIYIRKSKKVNLEDILIGVAGIEEQ
jgi:Zn finger protein HypA/HybF involved in hydrogenase expression